MPFAMFLTVVVFCVGRFEMRKILILLMLIGPFTLVSPAKAEEGFTVEEEAWREYFTYLGASLTYAEICNGKDISLSRPENAMLNENHKLLVKQNVKIVHLREPQASMLSLVQASKGAQDEMQNSVKQQIKVEGCQSPKFSSLTSVFDFMSKSSPEAVVDTINKLVVKKGGTVTMTMEEPKF